MQINRLSTWSSQGETELVITCEHFFFRNTRLIPRVISKISLEISKKIENSICNTSIRYIYVVIMAPGGRVSCKNGMGKKESVFLY